MDLVRLAPLQGRSPGEESRLERRDRLASRPDDTRDRHGGDRILLVALCAQAPAAKRGDDKQGDDQDKVVKGPKGLKFYKPPKPLPKAHGELIWSRGATGVTPLAGTYRKYPGIGHGDIPFASQADTLAFLRERLPPPR
jgi:hypothetical protein